MISCIVALSENKVIGVNNTLPWKLPVDLRYFRETTTGKTVVMGRKTFDSIGKPLPNRRNIVVTRQTEWEHEGVEVVHSVDEAVDISSNDGEVFIIGGEQIYRKAIDLADKLYITQVHIHVKGDAYFPMLDTSKWKVSSSEPYTSLDDTIPSCTFVIMDRKT